MIRTRAGLAGQSAELHLEPAVRAVLSERKHFEPSAAVAPRHGRRVLGQHRLAARRMKQFEEVTPDRVARECKAEPCRSRRGVNYPAPTVSLQNQIGRAMRHEPIQCRGFPRRNSAPHYFRGPCFAPSESAKCQLGKLTMPPGL